jgi:hypothetical protein
MSEDRESTNVGLSFLAERARTRRGAGRTGGGDTPPVEVTVRCEGRRHRIVLTRAGRLTLPDHPKTEVRRHLDYHAEGGDPCPCVAALIAWRRFTRHGDDEAYEALPEALHEAARECRALARDRHLARFAEPRDDLLGRPFHERPGFLARVLSDLVGREWATLRGITCQVERPPLGGPSHFLSFSKGGLSRAELDLPRDWFRRVCRKGLALHEGCLVLNVTEAPGQEGVDLFFERCRPVRIPHRPLAFEEDWVAVARGPADDFRVVYRGRWDDQGVACVR